MGSGVGSGEAGSPGETSEDGDRCTAVGVEGADCDLPSLSMEAGGEARPSEGAPTGMHGAVYGGVLLTSAASAVRRGGARDTGGSGAERLGVDGGQ